MKQLFAFLLVLSACSSVFSQARIMDCTLQNANGSSTIITVLTDTAYDTIQIKVDIADTFYCKVSGTNVAGLGHTNDVIVKKSYLPPGWECASAIIYEKQNRNQQSLATLKVYPNPTTGKFMIEFNESRVGVEDVVVELRALVGNMLEQYHLQSTNGYLKKELDFQQPAGIYLISVCSKNDCITQKLIIAQ